MDLTFELLTAVHEAARRLNGVGTIIVVDVATSLLAAQEAAGATFPLTTIKADVRTLPIAEGRSSCSFCARLYCATMESSSGSTGAPGPIQPLEYETAHPDALLGTDRLLADLAGHSARGGALMIVSDGAQLVLGLVSTLVLARILAPSDFGLVAIVVSITAFVSTIRDFGLPMATVQRQSITHAELSALFWLNLKLAALVALVLAALAPAIAWFYGESQLTGITLVTTVGIFVVGLSTVHMGLLRRQMRFGAITGIETCGVAAGVVTGIAAALLGAGFWALVLQQLTTNVTTGAALWLISRWRPGPPRRASGVGETDLRACGRWSRTANT